MTDITARLLEHVLAEQQAYDAKRYSHAARHAAEMRALARVVEDGRRPQLEPLTYVAGAIGDTQGYELTLTDEGQIILRAHEASGRDAAFAMTPTQVSQLRRDLLRVLLCQRDREQP